MVETKKFKIRILKTDRKRLVKGLLIVLIFATAVFFGGLAGTYVAVRKTVPDISALETYEPAILTSIYGDDGKILKEIGPEKRIVLSYDQIPVSVRNAIIATEDPRFFKHKGVDVQGILRAVKENALNVFRSNRKAEGGSTITQQLARKLFLHPLQTIQRKLVEWYLAIQIEKKYSKQKIFEMYCNQFEFGNGAFGIEAASHLFFGKGVADLDLEEAAMIAGVLRGPTRYSPYKNPNLVVDRRNHVLTRMAVEGFISAAQAEETKKKPLNVLPLSREGSEFAGYFIEEIRKHLVDAFGEDVLYRGGLKVYTTLNADYQRFAEASLTKALRELDKRHGWRMDKLNLLQDKIFLQKKAKIETYWLRSWVTPRAEKDDLIDAIVLSVTKKEAVVRVKSFTGRLTNADVDWAFNDYRDKTKNLDRLIKPGDVILVKIKSKNEDKKELQVALDQEPKVQGAFLVEDPRTGQIKAMVGGYSFQGNDYLNRALQTQRQAGSAIKPLLYTAALENGFTPASRISDQPTDFEDKWQKTTWSPRNYDRKYKGMVTFRTGLEESRNVVTANILDRISPQVGVDYCKRFGISSTLYPYLSLALGTFEVTLLDMVSAFSTFPNKGVRIKPYYISRIEGRDGSILEENKLEADDVISAQTAYLMTYLLQGVVERGTAALASQLLNDKPLAGKTGTTDNNADARFIGFSPSLCAGVWIGYDDNKPLGGNEETGAVAALPAWIEFFKSVIEDEKKKAAAAGLELQREEFEVPSDIAFFPIDRLTGLLAAPFCKWRFMEAFLAGTEPMRYCSYEDHMLTFDYANGGKVRDER